MVDMVTMGGSAERVDGYYNCGGFSCGKSCDGDGCSANDGPLINRMEEMVVVSLLVERVGGWSFSAEIS